MSTSERNLPSCCNGDDKGTCCPGPTKTSVLDDVAHLRSLLAAATPGPWKKWNDAIYGATSQGRHSLVTSDSAVPNAALILAAVNALPALLGEIETLSTLRDEATAEQSHHPRNDETTESEGNR